MISLPFITFAFFHLRGYYLKSSREVKRLEAIARSPIYSQVSTTLAGLVVIRALRDGPRWRQHFEAHLAVNTRCYFAFIATARWLGFRLDLLASSFFAVALWTSVLLLRQTVDAGQIGLGLTYILQLIGVLQVGLLL